MSNGFNVQNALSAQHISANLGKYEAARSGFFTLAVNFENDLIKATAITDENATAADKISATDAQGYLYLNVVSAPVPTFTIEPLQYKRGNDTIKFAGTPSFDSGSIKVDDVVGLGTKSILMAWQRLAYNTKTRAGGRMKDYKKDCTLIEYTQDFEEIRRWTLYGCWISGLTEDEFNKEQDGKRQITAKIEYDRAEVDSETDITSFH